MQHEFLRRGQWPAWRLESRAGQQGRPHWPCAPVYRRGMEHIRSCRESWRIRL